jgi:hypothetical protein
MTPSKSRDRINVLSRGAGRLASVSEPRKFTSSALNSHCAKKKKLEHTCTECTASLIHTGSPQIATIYGDGQSQVESYSPTSTLLAIHAVLGSESEQMFLQHMGSGDFEEH